MQRSLNHRSNTEATKTLMIWLEFVFTRTRTVSYSHTMKKAPNQLGSKCGFHVQFPEEIKWKQEKTTFHHNYHFSALHLKPFTPGVSYKTLSSWLPNCILRFSHVERLENTIRDKPVYSQGPTRKSSVFFLLCMSFFACNKTVLTAFTDYFMSNIKIPRL